MSQVSTVVITPSDNTDYLNIVAEIDSRSTGYNGGKTQYKWGDDVYLLLYIGSQNVNITAGATSGSMALVRSEAVPISETVTFANVATASPSKPVTSLGAVRWFGSSPQNRVLELKDGVFNLKYTRTGKEPDVGVFIGQVNYTSRANVYKLTLPKKEAVNADDNFQVVAWFKAEAK